MRVCVACITATAVAVLFSPAPSWAQVCDPSDPTDIPKYEDPLVIPPAMPPASAPRGPRGVTNYEIAVRQFQQAVLPAACGDKPTTVWGYGKPDQPETFNFPGWTVEGRSYEPVRVKWINDLVDEDGYHLPHLLPVDRTLHWADPNFRNPRRAECDPDNENPPPWCWTPPAIASNGGPVPTVVHVHGAHVDSESDGGPEQWWLPAAKGLPGLYDHQGPRYASQGTRQPGVAVYEYDQSQRASTLWYHDHALGITRLNVYAGLAGFWIVRDGYEDDLNLPGPSPQVGDDGGPYYDIPIVIQDRSFQPDGKWFYPDNRAFFDGYTGPYWPDTPVPPKWNPEFFGETMVVNGKTWPYLDVEPRKYRLRFLNGCNSRFLILKLGQDSDGGSPPTMVQIGNEGGFLEGEPLDQDQILLGPAERADVIIDFSQYATEDPTAEPVEITMLNLGPDEPFGGLDSEWDPADPATTGQVMQFKVSRAPVADDSEVPDSLVGVEDLDDEGDPRWLTLNEITYVPDPSTPEEDIPVMALLGTLDEGPLEWDAPVTETIMQDDVETWGLINLTVDAHPIHLHLVHFQVLGRYPLVPDGEEVGFQERYEQYLLDKVDDPTLTPPDPMSFVGSLMTPYEWESGLKETVIANPGEITMVRAKFDKLGWYVWHCHILEHEDNEMMRPFIVESSSSGPPGPPAR